MILKDIDIDKLFEKTAEILQREITNLYQESTSKKLSPSSAKDLATYLKLLAYLREVQAKELAEMTEEQLLESDDTERTEKT